MDNQQQQARFLSSVIFGSSIKSDVTPSVAIQSAVAACGNKTQWLGETPEESARINSWMQTDLTNEKILLGKLCLLLLLCMCIYLTY